MLTYTYISILACCALLSVVFKNTWKRGCLSNTGQQQFSFMVFKKSRSPFGLAHRHARRHTCTHARTHACTNTQRHTLTRTHTRMHSHTHTHARTVSQQQAYCLVLRKPHSPPGLPHRYSFRNNQPLLHPVCLMPSRCLRSTHHRLTILPIFTRPGLRDGHSIFRDKHHICTGVRNPASAG